jgi:xanthine dehydrogenase accessory factor
VHSPAGLDIGARTPGEIALSICAEIVATRPRAEAPVVPRPRPPADDAVDPVCGMSVAAVAGSLHLEHAGRTWYFCGTGCQRAFAADPERYLS